MFVLNTRWRPYVCWYRVQSETEVKRVANISLIECNILPVVLTPTVLQLIER
jgi:hypothetical protein